MKTPKIFDEQRGKENEKNKQKATESEIVKMLRFFGKFWFFYYDDVIINFWPCISTPEERTWTAVENLQNNFPNGKRKNARTNNLKQEEKIILKIKIKKQEQKIKTILNKDQVQGLKF